MPPKHDLRCTNKELKNKTHLQATFTQVGRLLTKSTSPKWHQLQHTVGFHYKERDVALKSLSLWLCLSVFSCYITIVLKWFQTPDWIFFAHWLFMCCSQVKTSINSNWCTIFCINDVCNVDWIILCLYNLIEYNNLLIFEESHRIFNHQRAAVIWSVLILLRNASFFLPSSAKPWCYWIRQAGGKKQKRFLS